MKRDQKATVVEEIAAQITESEAIYAADYRGLSVSQAATLRARLREADASFRIVKNTLTLRAADKAGAERVKELVQGPTAFAFVQGDPAAAAKALDLFARQENVLELRGGVLGTELLTAEALRQLARLPARDQLNAQMAGVVAAPLTGLVRGLGSLLSGLAIALGQLREMKPAAPAEDAQAEAPEEPQAEAPEEPRAEAEAPAEPPAAQEAEGADEPDRQEEQQDSETQAEAEGKNENEEAE
jgi:large subunit ribosomal protein L10